jgi:hypothetical protein
VGGGAGPGARVGPVGGDAGPGGGPDRGVGGEGAGGAPVTRPEMVAEFAGARRGLYAAMRRARAEGRLALRRDERAPWEARLRAVERAWPEAQP